MRLAASIVAIVLVLFGATAVHAQHGNHHGGGSGGSRSDGMMTMCCEMDDAEGEMECDGMMGDGMGRMGDMGDMMSDHHDGDMGDMMEGKMKCKGKENGKCKCTCCKEMDEENDDPRASWLRTTRELPSLE